MTSLIECLEKIPDIEYQPKQRERVYACLWNLPKSGRYTPCSIARMIEIPDSNCRRILGELLKLGLINKVKTKSVAHRLQRYYISDSNRVVYRTNLKTNLRPL